MDIKNIAVIGAGTMGHGLAMVFALKSCQVRLQDVSPEVLPEAKKLIAGKLETLSNMGLISREDRSREVAKRITYTTDLAEAVAGADFVLEAIFEDVPAKKNLFTQLEELAPRAAILASNTSYLNIYQFVEIEHPERLIITHWYEPPYIVPLVEIVPGPRTAPGTVERIKKFHDELGKEPIILEKFLPGFIGNRLQAALSLEVFNLLDNGYATPEDIDKAAKASFGLRLPILGLVQRMDFTGLDMVRRALANKAYRSPELRGRSDILEAHIAEGRQGVKNGRGFYDYQGRTTKEILQDRDIKLLKLKAFLENIE